MTAHLNALHNAWFVAASAVVESQHLPTAEVEPLVADRDAKRKEYLAAFWRDADQQQAEAALSTTKAA